MELSVSVLNDSLPFRMEYLFPVYTVNSLGGENRKQSHQNDFIRQILLLINKCIN